MSTLPPAYELTVQRDQKTGALVGFTEVCKENYFESWILVVWAYVSYYHL